MSGTDLPTQKISDEMVQAFFNGRAAWMREHGDIPTPEDAVAYYRAGLAAALVASGYRREVDVLREAADRIDPGPASTRRPALNDLDDMQMTCDRGVATRLRTWANVRERDRATALEQAQPLLAAGSEVESLEPVGVSPEAIWWEHPDADRATALEQAQPLPVADGLVCRHGWVVTDRVVDCPPECREARAEIAGRVEYGAAHGSCEHWGSWPTAESLIAWLPDNPGWRPLIRVTSGVAAEGRERSEEKEHG